MPVKISQRPEYAVLAAVLTEARERAGLSQNELARRLRRRQVIIWRFENALQSPDLVELSDLAAAIGTKLSEIIADWERRTSVVMHGD